MESKFDIIIAGGGLAGLTLGLQLKQGNPTASILIAEKNSESPEQAAHKVGESTVELGTYYLREVLGIKNYLDQHQLPKHGLRFFLTPSKRDQIDQRAELGPINPPPVPSHQLDRGILENELMRRNSEIGNTVVLGASVIGAEISEFNHTVTIEIGSEKKEVSTKWLVDATGRLAFLKRKLDLKKSVEHEINTCWFRIKGEIDVTNWSENPVWKEKLKPGLRRLSTSHLMGTGYWVWLIPLSSGNTSVGIVADPRYVDFSSINRFEKALKWLNINEPQCGAVIESKKADLLDFKVLKKYSHDSKQLYSHDRWCAVGDAGVFADPFYSPGTDFIGMSNTWITDLITRDLNQEDIHVRTIVYERTHKAMFENWLTIYHDKYALFGQSQVMIPKIFWDWANYWSVPTLLFFNNGYTDMNVLRALFFNEDSAGQKFGRLNQNLQKLFMDWGNINLDDHSNFYIDPFEIEFLEELHLALNEKLKGSELISQIEKNVLLLEQIGAEIIRYVWFIKTGQYSKESIDPYVFDLSGSESQFNGWNNPNWKYNLNIAEQLEKIWLKKPQIEQSQSVDK